MGPWSNAAARNRVRRSNHDQRETPERLANPKAVKHSAVQVTRRSTCEGNNVMENHALRSLVRTHIGLLATALLVMAGLLMPHTAAADEGGVSFWLPGQYSSFAATPAETGWSLPVIYFHSSADAGGSRSFARGGTLDRRVGCHQRPAVPRAHLHVRHSGGRRAAVAQRHGGVRAREGRRGRHTHRAGRHHGVGQPERHARPASATCIRRRR